VDSEGHIYIVDALQGNIQVYDRAGQFLLPFGGNGKRGGEFNLPSGIFIDASDRIFVSDTYNRRVQVFQYVKGSIQ
jgi:DNA-binding beta-propeller fold protein YncE